MYLTSAPGHLYVTEDGFDVQWGTNLVGKLFHCSCMFATTDDAHRSGPYEFTKLLLPALLTAAAESPDRKAHVTFTASQAQSTDIKFDTLTDTPARKKMNPDKRYGQSKFVSIRELLASFVAHQTHFPGERCPFEGVCKTIW